MNLPRSSREAAACESPARKSVCENSSSRFGVAQHHRFSAAKRRKNAAHGESRGCEWKMIQPRRAERAVLTHTRKCLVRVKKEPESRRDDTGSHAHSSAPVVDVPFPVSLFRQTSIPGLLPFSKSARALARRCTMPYETNHHPPTASQHVAARCARPARLQCAESLVRKRTSRSHRVLSFLQHCHLCSSAAGIRAYCEWH